MSLTVGKSVSQVVIPSVCLPLCLEKMSPPSQFKHSYVHKFVHFQKIQFCRHNDKSQGCYDKRRWYQTKMGKRHIRGHL